MESTQCFFPIKCNYFLMPNSPFFGTKQGYATVTTNVRRVCCASCVEVTSSFLVAR